MSGFGAQGVGIDKTRDDKDEDHEEDHWSPGADPCRRLLAPDFDQKLDKREGTHDHQIVVFQNHECVIEEIRQFCEQSDGGKYLPIESVGTLSTPSEKLRPKIPRTIIVSSA